jgi:hypothetical protein
MLHITVTVDAGTAGLTITNTAQVGAVDQADLDPGNNTAAAAITVAQGWARVYLPLVLK